MLLGLLITYLLCCTVWKGNRRKINLRQRTYQSQGKTS
ncbi:hypothetical protein GLYMA_10G081951v4 [Glycine max]|nr:hypothetical protein GLYMA_10G081951v4 [Glycine max]KAH1137315.1 hypothetical protein GYH30_027350 [Glycine max]